MYPGTRELLPCNDAFRGLEEADGVIDAEGGCDTLAKSAAMSGVADADTDPGALVDGAIDVDCTTELECGDRDDNESNADPAADDAVELYHFTVGLVSS